MMKEGTFAHVVQGVGANPVALLVRVKHISRSIGIESTGGPHAGANRNEVAIRRHLHAPAAPQSLTIVEDRFVDGTFELVALEPQPDIQRKPQISCAVQFRAVCIFMIVARNSPAFGNRQIFIRDVVSGFAMQGSFGASLASPATGYGTVYYLEIILLFASLIAIGPLARYASEPRTVQAKDFGLSQFPT